MALCKNIFLITVAFVLLLLHGCTKKTDEVFPESADIRLQKVIDAYNSKLREGPGWKLFVYPQGLRSLDIEVGGLTYYLTFPDSNRVRMVSDFTTEMATTAKESGYKIKAEQRPSLIFDTYSYIHVAADPDANVSFSPANEGGYGWGTDYDLAFTTTTPSDTIILKGNFNNSDAYLIKATEAEMTAAFSGGVADIMEATTTFSAQPFLFFNTADNTKVGVSFNLFLYRINFNLLADGNLITVNAPFSHTTYGLHLKEPITVAGVTFQDLVWDPNVQRYYIEVSGGRLDITTSATPLFPFHTQLGKAITTIRVPTTALPGQSATFATTYQTIKDNLINSPYELTLDIIDFIFDQQSQTMAMNVNVKQNGTNFIAQYVYAYTINTNNVARFNRIQVNGNAALIENEMAPMLDYIENDRFEMDYYTDVTPVLAQFTSIENPGFFFTGNIQ